MSQRIRNKLRLDPDWEQVPTTQEDNHFGIIDKYESEKSNEVYTFYNDGDRNITPLNNFYE